MSFVVLTTTFYMNFFILSLRKGKLLFSFFLPNHDFSFLNNKLTDIAKNKSELKIGKIFYCITVLNLPSKPLFYYDNTVCIDNILCWNVDGNSIYGYVWTAFSFCPSNSQAYAIIAKNHRMISIGHLEAQQFVMDTGSSRAITTLSFT